MLSLESLGWNSYFQDAFEAIKVSGFKIGRVAIENRQQYLLYSEQGEFIAEVSGKLLYESESAADLPKVGDWVVISLLEKEGKAIIHYVLKRKSKFSRKVAGNKTEEQIVAANIDIIFIVQGLDNNFNLRRLERYLIMAYESGAKPVIILNKVDLCEDYKKRAAKVEEIAFGVPIIVVSAKTGYGIGKIKNFIKEGVTFAFIGSSGVGKSTIINVIVGKEILKTKEVRTKDSKGRHVTEKRELIILASGGLLIDTPGMRELQLWSASYGLDETFADIQNLALNCYFSDCSHINEKKCAVIEAANKGIISEKRYRSYIKLQKELDYLKTRQNKSAFLEEKKRIKNLHKEFRRIKTAKENRKWKGQIKK